MNRGTIAELARLKIRYPLWVVTRAGVSLREYQASRGGLVIRAATPADLENRIDAAERHRPS